MNFESPPATGTFFYSVFGLRVRTNRPVSVFLPADPGPTDIAFHLEGPGPHPFQHLDRREWYECPDTDAAGQPLLRAWKLEEGAYFHFRFSEGPEFFCDQAGESVWSYWPEHLAFDDVITFLAGPAFGCLLFVRRTALLHGSAIAIGDKAIALLGPPGAGKSTTAAAFALAGFPALTDDIIALREQAGEFLVQPAYLRLCLWPDSVEALCGSADALPLITAGWEKRCLALGDHGRFQEQALHLAAIYVLDQRTSPEPSGTISALAPRELLVRLLANTYGGRLPNERRAQEFDQLARLANSVPGRRATAHPSSQNIRGLCNNIVEDFERIADARKDCLCTTS